MMGDSPVQRLASISVDFESIFYYANTLGLPYPDLDEDYDRVAHRYLELLCETGVRGTFFLVGRDIETGKLSRAMLRSLSSAGHELANHTMTHPHDMTRLSRADKVREIYDAGRLIEDIIGRRVVGFRAPCFDVDEEIVDILVEHEYLYDSSVYPCFLKPIQEVCYYLLCRGKFRNTGSWKYGFAPGTPYSPDSHLHRRGAKNIIELPIATVPLLRLPFYSTVLFALGKRFFDFSYAAVRRRLAFTYELHSIDLADYDRDRLGQRYPGIERHPSMRCSLDEKVALLRYAITRFRSDYELVTLAEMVERMRRLWKSSSS